MKKLKLKRKDFLIYFNLKSPSYRDIARAFCINNGKNDKIGLRKNLFR